MPDDVYQYDDDGMDCQEESDEQSAMDCGFIGSLEPANDDIVALIMMEQIDGIGRSCARERRQACQKLVSEIYSPPRVTKEIMDGRWRHVAPGFALDLTVNGP